MGFPPSGPPEDSHLLSRAHAGRTGAAGREARAAADASLRAAELDTRAGLDRLEHQRTTGVAAVRTARERADRMDDVLSNAGPAEHSLDEQFRLGAMTYLEYIDGLNRLNDTRTAALDIRLDLLLAHVDLYDLLGEQAPFVPTTAVEATP